ncbi:MAG TPA: PAS domain S-box protein, partial [Vicinamibacteria bacterium]|nr:PAS domain S-box protein [Vicinamibacteria bacterium]
KRMVASEGRYRALMEHANDAILIIEPQGRILEVNRATERVLGRPRDEIVGQQYPAFVVPEEREEVRDLTRRFPQERVFRVKSRHLLRPQGPPVAVEVSTALVPVGDEQVGVIILHDITERQRGEAALLAAQARLQHVVTSSPAVLFALSVQGTRLDLAWVSDNVERLLGYTVAEAMQPDWWTLALHPDDRERAFQHAATVLDMGYVALEYRFRNKAGAYLWLRTEMRLVGQSADVLEVIGSWSDVTARKEAELATQEAAEQYRLLFESNPQPMCVIDEQSLALLAVNDAAVRHYGYSREEFLAMTAADLRPPEDVGAFLAAIRAQGSRFYKSTENTWRHRRKDGTLIEVEAGASRITFEGRPAWLTVYTDVTEKKSLEAQLVQAQRIESLGRLAGGVAHDFNNLLGIISGYGDLLRQRVSGDARLSTYARDILDAAERAAGLTRQLLAFSRKQVLQPRPLDLNTVVADVEKMLRRLIGEDVQLLTIFQEDLVPVRADPGQVEQVLMNLAVNARDAMPRGGRLTIETAEYEIDEAYARLHPELSVGRYVMLAVSDTGEGMTPEVRARIFEPFFTTKEVGKGTGLGLATVHGIVRQSGGHVWVYSEVGQGTTFKILLPRADQEAPAEVGEAPRPALPGGTETVLVVEDEAGLRGLIGECLQGAGYTVLEAPDGLSALEVSDRHPGAIDLLLTDTVMPGMTGRELAETLLVRRPGVAVLFTSGYTDDTVVLRGVLAEEMDFLQKPFTLEALARTVREVLDKARRSAG